MSIDHADLYIQSADVAGREAALEQTLRALPGVQRVELAGLDSEALEARVRVAFDPEQTDTIIIEDALNRAGFSVISAGERG